MVWEHKTCSKTWDGIRKELMSDWLLWRSPVSVLPAPRWRPRSRALSPGLQGPRAAVGGSRAGARRWRGRGRRSTWWHCRETRWQERSRSDASGGVRNATRQRHSSELLDLQVKSPWKATMGKEAEVEHGEIINVVHGCWYHWWLGSLMQAGCIQHAWWVLACVLLIFIICCVFYCFCSRLCLPCVSLDWKTNTPLGQ